MRIAKFGTGSIFSSWANLVTADTLRGMGHEVFNGVIPVNDHGNITYELGPHRYKKVMASMPTLEQLASCDAIIVAAPEFLEPWLISLYGLDAWRPLKARKIGFYVESSDREEVHWSPRYINLTRWLDVHIFPDPRDAERFGGYHFRPCVDLHVFKPCAIHSGDGSECTNACELRRMAEKKYDAAFLGTVYQKRMLFLSRLLPLIPDLDFKAAGVVVRDLGGECHRDWVELSAKNLRQIKVHVGLPSNNAKMAVTRLYETLACGTFLLTYRTEDTQFVDGVHLRMFDADKPQECADLIRYYLEHEDEREAIAAAGLAEIRRDYSMETRMNEILETVMPEFDPYPARSMAQCAAQIPVQTKEQREHGILLQHV